MSKIAYVHIDEHLISSSLLCPICLDILQEPHTHIECDSAFCRLCLLQLAEPLCPICRWGWNDLIPIEYNSQLPRANRLIRNMLDELFVQCLTCQTIRRRGQFEHECQPLLRRISQSTPITSSRRWEQFRVMLSAIVIFLFIFIAYFYRSIIFEPAIDRRDRLTTGSAINIDNFLLNQLSYLIIKMISYSMPIFFVNIFLWLSVTFIGDQWTSKTTRRLCCKFLEISIIINLIAYSFHN